MRQYSVVFDNWTGQYTIIFRDVGDEIWYRDTGVPPFADKEAAIRVGSALNRASTY